MDPFYAFLIFVVLLVLDLTAAQTWLGPYFRFGIPVYRRRFSRTVPIDPAQLVASLGVLFKSSPLNPTLRFKPVGGNATAVRESLFENRTGLRYLPVFHSTLFQNADHQQLTLIGFINWYVIGTLIYVVYRILDDPSYAVVGVLVVIIFIISYIGQASVANRVGKAIEEM